MILTFTSLHSTAYFARHKSHDIKNIINCMIKLKRNTLHTLFHYSISIHLNIMNRIIFLPCSKKTEKKENPRRKHAALRSLCCVVFFGIFDGTQGAVPRKFPAQHLRDITGKGGKYTYEFHCTTGEYNCIYSLLK